MGEKTVFISYSHDSDEHREGVLALSERLREDGIETLLDQYVNGSPQQGWPRWMLDQLDAADSVLVVCTETYYRRFRGHEEPGKGKGVDWEGALITQEIYDSRSRTLKFVPVFLGTANEDWIPEPLRSGTHYSLTSKSGYQGLYDFLLAQAGVEPRPVGALKAKPLEKGAPLTFDEPPASKEAKIDISRIIKYAPAELIGREAETKLLSDAWDKAVRGETKRPHVLTFVALGGEGKTSLVAKWAAELAHQNWPGCEAVFAWSFYHQGTDEKSTDSSDVFLKEALTFFGDPEIAGSAQGAFDKGRRLAQLVGERRALLILDGLEPLQYAPTSPTPGELKDQGLAALLKGLAATNLGLCVITTRYSIPDLRAYWQTTAPEVKLTRLSKAAGVALLQKLGMKGTQKEFETLVEDVQGQALTLNLLGKYLHDAYAGDIRKRGLVKLEEASDEQGGHAFHVMDAYVEWFESGGKNEEENKKGQRALAVLRLMGLFDRPATADCLAALQKAPAIPDLTEALVGMSEAQRNVAFTRLEAAKLLTVNRDAAGPLVSLDAHPLLREYFAQQLRTQHPEASRAAHRRLYEYLCATTPDKPDAKLEDLQPLYQAVAHGCQARLQQEACDKVFYTRIQRGAEDYAAKKLGAFGSELGAVGCFFEQPWSRVSPALTEGDQAWLLAVAAFDLRALGRLTEALGLMRAGLESYRKQENWKQAGAMASNLSELDLTLGEVAGAVGDAEQSVSHGERSGDAFERQTYRVILADALHHAGRRAEAESRFHEAEQMQAERQPDYPLLYSLSGFRYCDLLLTEPERTAWRVTCSGDPRPPGDSDAHTATLQAVSERAAQTRKWMQAYSGAPLLDIAFDHLTLGRAALYAAIVEGSSLEPCHASLQHAVDGLRRAGTTHHIPRSLLTRAWLRCLEDKRTGPESAQSDLNEAWEIAERGPMKLHMADIHLHRARLFFREAQYPWGSPAADLAAARELIQKYGYGRRKEELEDAEAAARTWYRVSQKPATPQVNTSEPIGATPGSHAIHVPSIQPGDLPDRDLVYISYSHRDKLWHRKLRRILDTDPDVRDRVWDDTKISASADFAKEIDQHVARARIVIMLGSEHYFRPNSGAAHCETRPALDAHRNGKLDILWFPVGAHSYSNSPVGSIMAATGAGAIPLEKLSPREQNKALQMVHQEVRRCLGLAALLPEKLNKVTSARRHQRRRNPQPRLAVKSGKPEGTSIMQPPVDFVIITPLEEEREAMLAHLGNPKRLPPTHEDIRVYYPTTVPVTFTDGSTGKYTVMLTDLLGMGRVEAANAVGDAIRRWHPEYIVLVGIAGGLAKAGVSLGDVLISEQIADYELQKWTTDGAQIRWSVHRADQRLLGAAKQLRPEEWRPLIREARPEPGKSQRHAGPICTGDKVIANGLMDQYSDIWTKLIGVEMEAGGVASAAFQSANTPGFFMVRGVSDLADAEKDKPQTNSWRAYACDVAAAYVLAFLRSGPVPARISISVSSAAPPSSSALSIWQKKLAFLQAEEAKAADAEQKFSIQQRIEEALTKIQELGG